MKQGTCPKCNSDNLNWFDTKEMTDSIDYLFTCKDCGFEGIEQCNIVFDCFTDIYGNEVN